MEHLSAVWQADGSHGEAGLRLLVDGIDLIELVRASELPEAEKEGSPDLAGSYAGLGVRSLRGRLAEHFLGAPDSHLHSGHREKTVLLGCSCGEPGCWPLLARVRASRSEVRWDRFEQPFRRGRWSYQDLGPFVFDRDLYEQALADAETSTP